MPLKILISDGNVHDSPRAEELIKDFKAKYLISDKGYDSGSIVEFAAKIGMKAVIPSRSNAKMQRNYDKELYKKRHIVEIFFLKVKKFRSISTRYTKNIFSFHILPHNRIHHALLQFPLTTVFSHTCGIYNSAVYHPPAGILKLLPQ